MDWKLPKPRGLKEAMIPINMETSNIDLETYTMVCGKGISKIRSVISIQKSSN